MHTETTALGSAFSDWSELTDEYIAGMQALRRREPGASARMMRMAKLMSEYQQLLGSAATGKIGLPAVTPTAAPRASSWLKSTAATLFGSFNSASVLH
ncbi:hypothetical protein [Variovorax guangxiensis]|nr:hypothetical protein [Variovorax guangxiensis]